MIHDVYARLSPALRTVVDDAHAAVCAEFSAEHLHCKNDDDAERLVEAIAVYLLAGNTLLTVSKRSGETELHRA